MNKLSKIKRLLSLAVIVTMLAGSLTMTLTGAFGLEAAWLKVYSVCLAASVFLAVLSLSFAALVVGSVAAVAAGGAVLLSGNVDVGNVWSAVVSAVSNGDKAALLPVSTGLTVFFCLFFTVVFFALLRSKGGTAFAAAIALAVLIGGNTSHTADPLAGVPALIALIAAFAHNAENDRTVRGFTRALLPAAAAVLIAMLLVPASPTTWEPLSDAANEIRDTFDDYFHFTQERLAFSLLDAGYDHAQMLNDNVESMLGGPADPADTPVLRVRASSDMLLRGVVRRHYTGYSWIDPEAKARYLYYDFTRAGTRSRVFENDLPKGSARAFVLAEGEVEFLAEGTSSLFVPHRVAEFDLPLKTATFYNSIGEMFLSRNVAEGDRYAFSAYIPLHGEDMRALVGGCMQEEDEGYYEARETCLALPDGIAQEVYALVGELVAPYTNDYAKAEAILNWLGENIAYKLDVNYPPAGRDFVSWFLLEEKAGYCSHFASAMAVMCRIAGLPARYVEGYAVKANPLGETVLTGEDAHAWAEVYFNGLGWVSFDPTPADRSEIGDGDDTADDPQSDSTENEPPTDGEQDDNSAVPPPAGDKPTLPPLLPDATPTPDPFDHIPTPSPDPFGGPMNTPAPSNDPTQNEPPQNKPTQNDPAANETDKNSRWWLWLVAGILFLLILAALGWLWAKQRLKKTDPVRLAGQAASREEGCLIFYRAILTLLQQAGQTPFSGESPAVFAGRLSESGFANPEFERFAERVALSRYADRSLQTGDMELGARAYAIFLRKLRRRERLRFSFVRLFRGLGRFDMIP